MNRVCLSERVCFEFAYSVLLRILSRPLFSGPLQVLASRTDRNCFVVSTWVLMNMDTKAMVRITDDVRAEFAPWARDPPK